MGPIDNTNSSASALRIRVQCAQAILITGLMLSSGFGSAFASGGVKSLPRLQHVSVTPLVSSLEITILACVILSHWFGTYFHGLYLASVSAFARHVSLILPWKAQRFHHSAFSPHRHRLFRRNSYLVRLHLVGVEYQHSPLSRRFVIHQLRIPHVPLPR